MREIDELCRRYSPQFIAMVDNILDIYYFRDLLPELQKRKLNLGLFYETKANLTKQQIEALYDAGIYSIQPGIESLNTAILGIMQKGTTAVQNVQLLKWCKELGVKPFWNLIYGFPGEDPAAYESTAQIVEKIHHLEPPVGSGAIRLDRFRPNFVDSDGLGLCKVRPDRNYAYIYDLPDSDLFNLAYYFEHDYSDGWHPEAYVSEAYRAFSRWQADASSRGLVYADHGHSLAIWDLRSGAAKTQTTLATHERAADLYCDQNRSLSHIKTFLRESADGNVQITTLVEQLVADKLMIEIDDHYLSLAIPISVHGLERADRSHHAGEYLAM